MSSGAFTLSGLAANRISVGVPGWPCVMRIGSRRTGEVSEDVQYRKRLAGNHHQPCSITD
jgi:hypothetical protein